ncbi:MAG: hypothetical protein HRT99_01365 [Mycoplasmatales bacterium]|nr:hypothetical protein [Mycoplasmatales bacterium]
MRSSKKWTKEEIQNKSRELIGKKVWEVLSTEHKNNNKGSIGLSVETDIFNISNNSDRRPDFKDAEIELKVIPLKETSKNTLVPKERMVLTMIDYMEDYKHEFYNSHLYKKVKTMQIIQYKHDLRKKYDSVFIDEYILEFPGQDKEVIQADYNTIIEKIKNGNAHLISESDTNYLSACRKGAGRNKDLRKQPFSEKLAPSRAFSLKAQYLRVLNERRKPINKNIFKLEDLEKFNYSFEKLMKFKIKEYIGMTKKDLINKLSLQKNANSKQIMNLIISKIFNYEKNISKAPEIKKAGIIPKTIRVIKGKVTESMSFEQIDPTELSEKKWEDSEQYYRFRNEKFAFFIFGGDSKEELTFKSMKIWKMPKEDIDEYKSIYVDMQKKINKSGSVWKEGKTFKNFFPKSNNHSIGHVRPKGKNSKDTYKLPSGDETPKQAFWLNKKYIQKIIEN